MKRYLLYIGIALIPLLLLIQPIGFLGFFLAAFILGFLAPLIATALNLALCYFAVRRLKIVLYAKVGLFLLLSMILSLNVRIPGIISDIFYHATGGQKIQTYQKIVLPRTVPVSLILKSTDEIEYRQDPLSTYMLVCDLLVHGNHIGLPTMREINVEQYLLSKGFLVQKNGDSETKVILDVQDNGYTVHVNATIQKGNQKSASYSNRFRKAYLFENHGKLAKYKNEYDSISTGQKFLLALFQDQLWSHFFTFALHNMYDYKPITAFIDESIEVGKQGAPEVKTKSIEAKATKTDRNEDKFDPKEYYADYKIIHGNRVKDCGGESRKTKVLMPFPDTHYLLFKSMNSERKIFFAEAYPYMNLKSNGVSFFPDKVICSKEEVFVIGNHVISNFKKYSLLVYSIDGDLLKVYNIALPEIKWTGNPRKEIIDFAENNNSYEFTLLDIMNTILGGYRVSFEK